MARLAHAVITAIAAITLGGCQSIEQQMHLSEPGTEVWKPVNPGSLGIRLNEIDVGVIAHSARSRTIDGRFRIHDGQWRGTSGWPRIRLLMHDLTSTRVTFAENNAFDRPIHERIGKAFEDYQITLGAPGEHANRLGRLKFQRFVVNRKNHCVFISQFTSPSYELRAGDGEELGQIYIEGSFCSRAGIKLTDTDIRNFATGIDVRG